MKTPMIGIAVMIALAALAGCQSKAKPGPGSAWRSTRRKPRCQRWSVWRSPQIIAGSNRAIQASSPIVWRRNLNSYSGRPRILVVPASNPGGRPLLVVHAEGNPAKVEVFGPLMSIRPAIASPDVRGGGCRRWAGGHGRPVTQANRSLLITGQPRSFNPHPERSKLSLSAASRLHFPAIRRKQAALKLRSRATWQDQR